MNEYLLVKWIHILSATLLFGTGLGSAFYKWLTDRSGDIHAIAVTNRLVVIADWLITTPTVLIQPISGLWLLHLMDISLNQGWVILTIILYVIAGICWLPVVWLQIRMRDMAQEACQRNIKLEGQYQHLADIWFMLGVPAFTAMVVIYFLMVFKPTFLA
ncbi:MAG: DUF2269 domain-containing protein [Candidatus Thiodiazotropha sp.]|jgi:uncharacterized membrane protein